MKIVILDDKLSDDERISFGDVEIVEADAATSVDDFLTKTEGADAIYDADTEYLLEVLPKLHNVYVTYPFIELGDFSSEELAKNNVFVANARGANKNSIVEWVMFMVLALLRKFPEKTRVSANIDFERTRSLENKNVLVVGHGDIGSEIGRRCEAFAMSVSFYERGENIAEEVKNADVVVNALNVNSSSRNLISADVFADMKQDAVFVSFARRHTYDLDGLIQAIKSGRVAGAAIDCDPESSGDVENDFYQTALSCDKILVTPHVAFASDVAGENGHKVAVENLVKFAHGEMVNVVKK
jgi:phosphoglycerate dehydrogenase-like enzyme